MEGRIFMLVYTAGALWAFLWFACAITLLGFMVPFDDRVSTELRIGFGIFMYAPPLLALTNAAVECIRAAPPD